MIQETYQVYEGDKEDCLIEMWGERQNKAKPTAPIMCSPWLMPKT